VDRWRSWLTREVSAKLYTAGYLQGRFLADELAERTTDTRAAYLKLLDTIGTFLGVFHLRVCCPPSGYPGTGGLILSPHLGLSKLMKDGFRHGLGALASAVLAYVPNREPWMWRHVVPFFVSRALRLGRFRPMEISYGPVAEHVQASYGAIVIPRWGGGGHRQLVEAVVSDRDTIVSLFPEGRTTGKYEGTHHQITGSFRSGWAHAATSLRRSVILVPHVVLQDGTSVASSRTLPNGGPSGARQLRERGEAEMRRLMMSLSRRIADGDVWQGGNARAYVL